VNYEKYSVFFKALADENRLKIIEMLSSGEICACEILLKLAIAQSTLSHHMKILCDCSLVHARKNGKWTFYSLDKKVINETKIFINTITAKKGKPVCNNAKEGCV